MKDFLKFTLATVTGIILSSIVLFIIGMVTLFGIVSTSDTETVVKKNSVMMLDLNGTLVERTQESPLGLELHTHLCRKSATHYSTLKKAESSLLPMETAIHKDCIIFPV